MVFHLQKMVLHDGLLTLRLNNWNLYAVIMFWYDDKVYKHHRECLHAQINGMLHITVMSNKYSM